MKILFLCASLEPGRDGVGDYTRRLAAECVRRGHRCAIVGLHDSFVPEVSSEEEPITLYRLSISLPWADRIARTESYAAALAPDWISWQFVAYGFSPRGFVPTALLDLAVRLRSAQRHIMLHELWIGLEKGSASWARLNGSVQRRATLQFLRRLRANVVQTSNPAYQAALQREGISATVLSLFGNVPVSTDSTPAGDTLASWLCGSAANRTSALVAVTFGTLHPQWRPDSTAKWLARTAADHGKRAVLLVVGRAGPHVSAIAASFRKHGSEVTQVGEQDPTTVSQLLQHADFGIAAHPWALLGKSGVVAAMLDHGLPVVVPRHDWHLRDAPEVQPEATDPLLAPMNSLDPSRARRWLATRRPPSSMLPRVAESFLRGLTTPSVE